LSGKISLLAIVLSRWGSVPIMIFGLCVSMRLWRYILFLSLCSWLNQTGDQNKIEELEKSINTIAKGSKGNLPNIIFGGDYHI
jgi:hypothetical protein